MIRRCVAIAFVSVVLVTACSEQDAEVSVASASSSPVASPSPSPSPDQQRAEEAVEEFLSVVGLNSERAWELLSSRSQQSFGSFEAFADLSSEYGEGVAAFSGLDASRTDVGDGLSVLVLHGEVTREGMTETDAVAVPVRREGAAPKVELAAPRAPEQVVIEVPQRASGPVERGAELRAVVPAASDVTVLVDDDAYQFETAPADGDRMLVTLSPDLPPGPHVLTVVAVRPDGLLLAQAVAFRVSG